MNAELAKDKLISLYLLLGKEEQMEKLPLEVTRTASGLRAVLGRLTRRLRPVGPHYKWIALSNTTIGAVMATSDASIVLIAFPAIFKGIGINPLASRGDQLFPLAAAWLHGRDCDAPGNLWAHLRYVWPGAFV